MGWISRWFQREAKEPAPASAVTEEQPVPAPDDHHHYNSDQPITTRSEDRFNRAPFASRIADTIAGRADPSSIVIGLYGPWGDGKTSVLEMMDEALKGHSHVVSIKFNPWHFQSEELLLRGFFSTLADALGKSLPTKKEKVGETIQRYGDLLSLASVSMAGGIVEVNAGAAAKGLGASLSTVELIELKRRLEVILDESGKRVAVLVDDIDRLDRQETHAIFKLVKLSANFRHISYVLAFDDAVVAAALGERYGAGGQEAGRAFLEKIIQVPLHLPPADEIALRHLAFEGVEQALNQSGINLQQQQVDAFIRHFVDGLEPRLTTPRLAKLYVNAVTFALPLLKGEVDAAELMLIEGLRVFYPKLYAEVRDHPDLFLNGKQQNAYNAFAGQQQEDDVDVLLQRGIPGASEKDRQRVRKGLLEPLFPRLRMNHGADWESAWASKQKICSGQYFQRYFTYCVPDGDIPDAAVNTLIRDIGGADLEEQKRILEDFSRRRSIPRLISKLRDASERMTDVEARNLLLALVRNAHVLPRERVMTIGDTWMQGGILASQLLRRLPDSNRRQEAAEAAAQVVAPLNFCQEYLRWISHSDDRPEERRVLSDEGEVAVRSILANRLRDAETESPLYLAFGRDTSSLYLIWAKHSGAQVVGEALLARFQLAPADVDAFLDCYVGEGWIVESGLPVRSDLRREQYDSISELVPPEFIVANLIERFGDELKTPTYHCDDNMPIARRIAHQFAFLHNAVLIERIKDVGAVAPPNESAAADSGNHAASEQGGLPDRDNR